jgi:asparagine synthase (glutamine-hydrolysing)
MCGIFGILDLGGAPLGDDGLMRRMGDTIVHRGPDDFGYFADGPVQIGMRRLSIIDVAGGHQPISNEDGSIVAVCNGEIYNFRQLRSDLEKSGHRFSTHSDSETVVHLYEQHGDDFLKYLDGMFGLALWDQTRQRLVVARDALGIKPVYFGKFTGRLCFASEAKSLLQLPGFAAELNPSALQQYLATGYVAGPQSMFRGIDKLPPGCAIFAEKGRFEIRRFWKLPDDVDESRSESDWIEAVRAGIERAVTDQMVSDVPLGAFLSGGIDSSAVVAAMARNSDRPVKTYSIGFRGSSGAALYNELPFARIIADRFRTDHREIIVQPDVIGLLPQLLWHMDEPVADAAFLTTYLVSRFAREDVTVILSGVGGDELFGGYKRYLDGHYRRSYHRIPKLLRRGLVEPLLRRLPSDRHSKWLNPVRLAKAFVQADGLDFEARYTQFMEVFDAGLRSRLLRSGSSALDDRISAAFATSTSSDELRRLMDVDLATQMPEDLLALTDRMSMAVSLECRVPLLDQQLVELAARMPGRFKVRDGQLKWVLKKALEGTLPHGILHRAKRGFGAPIGAWFRAELAPVIREVLSPRAIERRGLLDPAQVAMVLREHELQRADRTDHLLALVNLEIWCRMYLDGQPHADVADSLRGVMAA